MNEIQTIEIQSEFDVFMARMQVRKLARATGFDVTSQARVALATSSLARALRLGETYQGRISIGRLDNGDRTGLQVACTAIQGEGLDTGSRAFSDVRWLIDDLLVKKLPAGDLQVTLIKWVK